MSKPTRRAWIALLAAAFAALTISAGSAPAFAEAPAAAQDAEFSATEQMESVGPYADCTVWALTDTVDRTNRVSGGGSVSCNGIPTARQLNITVTLYRDGTPVAADGQLCDAGRPSCWAGTDIADNRAGQQRWQVKVLIQDWHNETKWGNVLWH